MGVKKVVENRKTTYIASLENYLQLENYKQQTCNRAIYFF